MHAFKLNQPVPELQPVGSVSLLGRCQQKAIPVAVAMIYGKPEDVFTCGLFSSTRGGFTMIYPLPSTQPCWKGSGTHCCGSGTDTFFTGR